MFLALLSTACDGINRRHADTGGDADGDGDGDTTADGDLHSDEDREIDLEPDAEVLPRECPSDMVEVPGLSYCIDRYVASVDSSGAAQSVAGAVPASEASWLEADAACRAAGKVLCPDAVWLAACSAGGTRTRPYGDTYDPTACNGRDDDFDLLPASSLHGCEGGLDGLFDMTGNV